MKVATTLLILSCFCLTANATLIVVIDASNTASNTTLFNKSTDGETAAGIDAAFSTNEFAFPNTPDSSAWDGNRSFLNKFGAPLNTGIASWTFSGSGLTDGDVFDVFVTWGSTQGGLTAAAPYSINGGTAITKDQTSDTAADLELTDNVSPSTINFEFLGQGTVTGGQISISVSEPVAEQFIKLDAVAIRAISAVPEVSAAIALPFVMGLIGFSKMSRRRRRENRREEMAS